MYAISLPTTTKQNEKMNGLDLLQKHNFYKLFYLKTFLLNINF